MLASGRARRLGDALSRPHRQSSKAQTRALASSCDARARAPKIFRVIEIMGRHQNLPKESSGARPTPRPMVRLALYGDTGSFLVNRALEEAARLEGEAHIVEALPSLHAHANNDAIETFSRQHILRLLDARELPPMAVGVVAALIMVCCVVNLVVCHLLRFEDASNGGLVTLRRVEKQRGGVRTTEWLEATV